MIVADPDSHPLCQYFLSEYLANRDDPTNFPPEEIPALFDRYEEIFRSALSIFQMSREQLKGKAEFDFAHADQGNFEGAIAVLRAVEALRLQGFSQIALLKPPGADIVCEKNGRKVCCEVKAITKVSTPQKGLFFADQVHAKVMENIAHARKQLAETAKKLHGAVTMFVSVSNWFDQAIYLGEQDYQYIVNRLERDKLDGEGEYLESLNGVDVVFFATKFGQIYWFLKDELRASLLGGGDVSEAPKTDPIKKT
jgi:hypothetical protein